MVLAVASAWVAPAEVPSRIASLFDIVYGWLGDSGLQQRGDNHALYAMTEDGLRMRVGVPVSEAFTDTEAVGCVQLDVARAAHTVHRGEYAGLLEAHRALRRWASAQTLTTGPLSWEVYGDWSDDPARLRTDVFIELIGADDFGEAPPG